MFTISYKWIFCKKYNVDWSILKYKAHRIARGFFQKLGIDYHENFILVVKLTSLLILFSFIVALDFKIHQMDAHIGF